MIEIVAYLLVEQMISQYNIDEKNREIYVYSLVCFLENCITIGSVIVISVFLKNVSQTLLFLIFFLSLRRHTGGFHLNSFAQCYLGTIILYIVVLFIYSIIIDYPKVMFVLLILSICLIGIIGTVNHPNIYMNAFELSISKKMARIIVLCQGTVIFLLYYFGISMFYIGFMSLGVILCATLVCVAKITKQEV